MVLEGLQSETGKKLNGKYAMVISKEDKTVMVVGSAKSSEETEQLESKYPP